MRPSSLESSPSSLLLWAVACALSLLCPLGCDTYGAPAPITELRDSAGIAIVENTGEVGPDGGGWLVDSIPSLSVGTFSGDSVYQFYQVQGAVRLDDGRIVVANAGSGEIRVFDEGGQFLVPHGRKGEGPGEFQNPALVGVLGPDTLVVVDLELRRISLLQAGVGFLRSVRLSEDVGGGAYPQGMFGDGTLLLGGGFYWSSAGGVELSSGYSRRATNYLTAGLGGELLTEFGEFPGSEFFMQVQDQGGGVISMRARLIPFGKYAMEAVGQDRFYYASGDSWEIKVFDRTGKLGRLIRLARDPRPVQGENLEAQIQEEIGELSDPSGAPEVRAGYEDMPVPDFMPAMARLHSDARGYLWVERYRGPEEEAPVYDILDPEGRLVGSVTLPPKLEILEIGDDYVLALFRDELGVEFVRLLSLRRPM